ncbi:bifunctional acetaldehyde-CoA/alcohol dehydrogenase [Escherichia coli]|nr:bifunctional acetaldehyde-CoA/alcohol dehydrogenase [Escherichia coli]
MGVKAKMIAVTTTSGTGSEVTPFAVVTDDRYWSEIPAGGLCADPGYGDCRRQPGYGHAEVPVCFRCLDAVTHAMEAYVSVLASEFSDGQALQALNC